jgi:hypothetical protein
MKIMKKLTLLILLALGMAACAPVGAPSATPSPLPTEPPTPLPTVGIPTATPTAEPTAAPTAQATPGGVQPQAFSDCALLPALPGLPGCGGSKAAQLLSGELVLVDQANRRLVGVDYNTVQAWQIPLADLFPAAPTGFPAMLSFSPSGKLLAVYAPGNTGASFAILDAASGQEVGQITPSGVPDWTPQDSLEMAPFRTVWSGQGDAAWIDFNTAVAHLRLAADPGKEVTWPVAPAPSDQIPEAVAWVPGTDLLLFEQHFASNDMWVTGGELYTLDVKTGAVKDLKAHMKLDYQFAWNPTQAGLMALAESTNNPTMGGQRLATLDVVSGELKYLIDDAMVIASHPSWLPDGKTILFAVSLPPAAVQSNPIFESQGIFQVSSDGSGLKALTKPPQAQNISTATMHDDAPQLLADGKYFLYFRVDTSTDPGSSVLRLAALDGSLDEPLSGPLAAPQCTTSTMCNWEAVAIYK